MDQAAQTSRSTELRINVAETERYASLAGGALLALLGLRERGWLGLALGAISGDLIFRGVTGHCHVYDALNLSSIPREQPASRPRPRQAIRLEHTITVNRPVKEVFDFWRNLENLPHVFDYLKQVERLSDKFSRWVIELPGGASVEWTAKITNEVENELVAWRSLDNPDVDHAGSVMFAPGNDGQSTEVRVVITYTLSTGVTGTGLAARLGKSPEQQLADELRHFKSRLESGDLPPIPAEPMDDIVQAEREAMRGHEDVVEQASDGSFPASDPPGWTSTSL